MIDIKKIKSGVSSVIIGQNIYWYPKLDSTNEYAMELAKKGAPEGTIIGADYQTAGRGRGDKSWFSPAGKNILASVVLRPERNIEVSQKIVLAVADIIICSLRDYLEEHEKKKVSFGVKWPNDILYDGKKIAGILTQSILQGKRIEALVIGIGININTPQDEFPEELRQKATSLSAALDGKTVDINDIIIKLINNFEKKYIKLERTNYEGVVETWKKNCYNFGSEIMIDSPQGEKIKAVFEDVADDGFLVYRTGNERKKLISGSLEYI